MTRIFLSGIIVLLTVAPCEAIIAQTVLGSGTVQLPATTDTITPVAGQLILVSASIFKTSGPPPTLTGTGGLNVTWTRFTSVALPPYAALVYRGIPTSNVPGTLSTDGDSGTFMNYIVTTYRGVNQSTGSVGQGVQQGLVHFAAPGTELHTGTWGGTLTTGNAIIYSAYSSANTTYTPASGYTLGAVVANGQGTVGNQFRPDITIPDAFATFGASGNVASSSIELVAAPEPAKHKVTQTE